MINKEEIPLKRKFMNFEELLENELKGEVDQ